MLAAEPLFTSKKTQERCTPPVQVCLLQEVGFQGTRESDSPCTGCYHKDSWKPLPLNPIS